MQRKRPSFGTHKDVCTHAYMHRCIQEKVYIKQETTVNPSTAVIYVLIHLCWTLQSHIPQGHFTLQFRHVPIYNIYKNNCFPSVRKKVNDFLELKNKAPSPKITPWEVLTNLHLLVNFITHLMVRGYNLQCLMMKAWKSIGNAIRGMELWHKRGMTLWFFHPCVVKTCPPPHLVRLDLPYCYLTNQTNKCNQP